MTQEEARKAVEEYGSIAAAARALGRNERSFRRLLNKDKNKPEKKTKTVESVVLHLTDLHYGKKTDTFNVEVLKERLNTLVDHILQIYDILKSSYRFDCLYILFTGDTVDGDEIYASHPHHVDERARYGLEQATGMARLMQTIIERLRPIAPKIRVHGVPGNHGRVSRHTHENNNWDRAMYTMLQLIFEDDKDVEVTFAEKPLDIIEIQGHGFLLYHGAGIRMYQNIPFYGIRQRVLRWTKTLKQPFRVVLMGHFHQCLADTIDDVQIMLSGTTVSNDDWSIEWIGVDGEQRMRFFGVHPEHPVTWEYKLELK